MEVSPNSPEGSAYPSSVLRTSMGLFPSPRLPAVKLMMTGSPVGGTGAVLLPALPLAGTYASCSQEENRDIHTHSRRAAKRELCDFNSFIFLYFRMFTV